MPRSAIIFMIDGMRPDAMLSADAPTMHRLMRSGASTLCARTVMPSWSLPCHTSLFYGISPERHGVMGNTWRPFEPRIPSLFGIVHEAGHRTLMYYNWGELRDMAAPGLISESHLIAYKSGDPAETDRVLYDMARQRLARHDWGLAFLYYGSADLAGHDHGWMSSPYLRAIEAADRAVAGVLPSLPSDCLIILTADHGGHDRTHGEACDEDMTIPIVLSGPGIAAATQIPGGASIMDIAPTIALWLNIGAPAEWEGRNLLQAGQAQA